MKLAADPDMAEWLEAEPARQWDAGNRTKSETKHGFSQADTESIFEGDVYFAGRIVEPAHPEPRHLLLGVTARGLYVAVVFTRRGEYLRRISTRPMRPDERRKYDEAREREG